MKLCDDALEQQFMRAMGTALDGRVADATNPVWPALVELGAFGLTAPIDVGGLDLGFGIAVRLCEEIGARAERSAYLDTTAVIDAIELAGTAAGRARLTALVEGEHRVALVRYPDGGGSFTIVRSGDGWRVTGLAGTFAGSPDVDAMIVPVAEDGRISWYWLPADRVGVRITAPGDVAGGLLHTVHVGAVPLEDRDRVATLDPGGPAGRALTARARLRRAALLVGLARGAFEATLGYTSNRRQFGRRLAEFQAVAFSLSAVAAELAAVRMRVGHAAWLLDSGAADAGLAATESLALAAELALTATRRGLHLHGAHGMTTASTIHAFYARVAVEAVWAGTPHELWCEIADQRKVVTTTSVKERAA